MDSAAKCVLIYMLLWLWLCTVHSFLYIKTLWLHRCFVQSNWCSSESISVSCVLHLLPYSTITAGCYSPPPEFKWGPAPPYKTTPVRSCSGPRSRQGPPKLCLAELGLLATDSRVREGDRWGPWNWQQRHRYDVRHVCNTASIMTMKAML